jgi:hypothetical protein
MNKVFKVMLKDARQFVVFGLVLGIWAGGFLWTMYKFINYYIMHNPRYSYSDAAFLGLISSGLIWVGIPLVVAAILDWYDSAKNRSQRK